MINKSAAGRPALTVNEEKNETRAASFSSFRPAGLTRDRPAGTPLSEMPSSSLLHAVGLAATVGLTAALPGNDFEDDFKAWQVKWDKAAEYAEMDAATYQHRLEAWIENKGEGREEANTCCLSRFIRQPLSLFVLLCLHASNSPSYCYCTTSIVYHATPNSCRIHHLGRPRRIPQQARRPRRVHVPAGNE